MALKSVQDQLRDQFYDWELPGRGWTAWPRPVYLEPPFRPFGSHRAVFPQVMDDGRRPTLRSRMVDLLNTKIERRFKTVAVVQEQEDEPPVPRLIETGVPLRRFVIHVPRNRIVKTDVMSACLIGLRAAQYPLAFEIVGGKGQIAVQFASRASDERLLLATLRSYFPDVTAIPGDLLYDVFGRDDYTALGVFEVGLRREFMLPLGTVKGFDPDPLIALVGALEETTGDEGGAVQVLFEPAREPWAESIFRAVTDGEGGDFFLDAPEIARSGKQKALQPLFAVAVRIAVIGDDEVAASARLRCLASAIAQFESTTGNQFVKLEDDDSYDRQMDLLLRQSHRTGMLLGLDELASLVHLPSASVQSQALIGRAEVRSRALKEAESQGLYLGVNRHAGRETLVYLSLDRARRHVHVVGASGSGKSNLLLQLLLEDVRQGGGIALLDPHGDLVDDLMARLPENRIDDVILFDPADTDYPVGFNVLAAHSDLEKTLLASDLVAIFRRLSTSWGDQMHAVLANAIQAFLESTRGGTLADLRKFLVDPEFRKDFIRTIPDEEIVYYWQREFPLLRGQPQGPILTRLDSFLRPKLVRQMVTQRQNKVDFRVVMDEGKIFLAKLAQGAIGEENAALLGSFLVARLHQTAMSRQDVSAAKRRPFLIAADECQHFVTPSMASILSGARKYSVGLVLAHQDLTQLQRKDSEVFASLTANAGTRIVFRVGDSDARALADGFASFTAEDLRALSIGEAVCRFDRADHDFNLAVPLVETVDQDVAEGQRQWIVNRSREKYGQQPSTSETGKPEAPAKTDQRVVRAAAQERPQSQVQTAVVTRPADAQKPPSGVTRRERSSPEEAALGRGGAQHKYLQELVKRFAEAQGYRATIEKPTPSGGSVDVALEHADDSIAVEISVTSTSAYECGNVTKCLAAGYSRVVVIATERRRLDAIAKLLRSSLPDSDRARVDYLLPEDFLTSLSGRPRPAEQCVDGYNVTVNYKRTSAEEAKARHHAIASVLAKSVRKLDE